MKSTDSSGVMIPSWDTYHKTILLQFATTYGKRLTKSVQMLNLVLNLGWKWIGLDLVLITQCTGQCWHQNKNIHDSEAKNTEFFLDENACTPSLARCI